jgi:glycerol uptake facilitator-like aquaporin
MPPIDVTRKLAAETAGTGFLLAAVVGSGIMAETLAGGNMALALLGNTLPTGAILVVIILVFGPISGGHFNPAVTFAFLLRRDISFGTALAYISAQLAGGLLGAAFAHLMFELPVLQTSVNLRAGPAQWFSETLATFGLVVAVFGALRWKADAVPYIVGLYITSAYWFTASTSFANPAVTVARSFTDTFSGIFPGHAPAFIVAQFVGAGIATIFMVWLLKPVQTG